jgi:hypothetical protein
MRLDQNSALHGHRWRQRSMRHRRFGKGLARESASHEALEGPMEAPALPWGRTRVVPS